MADFNYVAGITEVLTNQLKQVRKVQIGRLREHVIIIRVEIEYFGVCVCVCVGGGGGGGGGGRRLRDDIMLSPLV